MAESIRAIAAAKVNLHLRVYPRRSDGFHSLLSLFQAVSLADSLVIRSLKESDTIEIEGDFDCPAKSTTIFKAAAAYMRATGQRRGLSISVEKRIPAGAGLGGGSSDAAATLVGLEALLRGGLSLDALRELGASIGSDVPFFFGSGAALVSGRGEIVEAIEARSDYSLLLVNPGFPVSTAAAYALLDRERADDSGEPDPSAETIAAAYGGSIVEWPYANSFEPVIGREWPEVGRIKGMLLDKGASFAAMSGSGSTIFGVFEDEASLRAASAAVAASGLAACEASPLARIIHVD
jgi:4-diphosphocytidyl-2C-methyl-D-erythritol kinase